MKLSIFIQTHMNNLLEEWEESTDNIAPSTQKTSNKTAFRHHAQQMLNFCAWEIEQPQISKDKTRKHTKLQPETIEETSAHSDRTECLQSEFTLTEVVTEHRALRAAVIRLWGEVKKELQQKDIQDLIRFNEAMDQLLYEAVFNYSSRKEKKNHLLEAMMSSSPDQICILDLEGRFFYINNALAEILEKPPSNIQGKTIYDLDIPLARELREKIHDVARTGKQYRGETLFCSTSGRTKIFEYSLIPVRDNDGNIEAVASAARDISERKESEYRNWKNTNVDLLTGLPNRSLFLDRLHQSLKESERTGTSFALLLIGLDQFKKANNTLGQHGGDMLLKQVAQRISACLRKADTLARLAGDEFRVILKGVKQTNEINTVANKILAEIVQPFHIKNHTTCVSASIGITTFPQDGKEADKLIAITNQAMYAAKQAGGNRFAIYNAFMQYDESEHARLKQDLHSAISRHELEVLYQPIVDLSNGSIYKAEALVKWDCPQNSFLTPVTFIKIAEQTGVIKDIEDWVFRQAAVRSREWGEQVGRSFQISINKAAVSFFTRDRVHHWKEHIEDVDLQGSKLMIEITEDALVNVSASSADLMKSLKTGGIELAIDDCSVGQFSMASLKACGINYLKLDQTFIQTMQATEIDQAVTRATIAMAHKMGLKIIASGVEADEQRRFLLEAGCDYAQGMLFSPPLSPEAFRKLLRVN